MGGGIGPRIWTAAGPDGVDEKHDNKWLEEVVNDDVSFWKLRLTTAETDAKIRLGIRRNLAQFTLRHGVVQSPTGTPASLDIGTTDVVGTHIPASTVP
jgi:hypothetical protein